MTENNTSITKNKVKKAISKKLEWDFNVPDYKNDILKISSVHAEGCITDLKISEGSVNAKVKIKVNMLYIPVPDENTPKLSSLESTETFVLKGEIPANTEWDLEDCELYISNVVPTVINSRKAGVKLNACINVTALKNSEIQTKIPEDIYVETKKKKMCASYIPILNSEKIDFSHSFSIPNGKPALRELLRLTSCIKNKEVKAVSNKAVLKGDLQFKILYASVQNTIDCFAYTVPFTEIIDARGIAENMEMMFNATPENVEFKIYADEENCQRNIDVNGYILFRLMAFKRNETEVVCDAFCPTHKEECVKEELDFCDIIGPIKDGYTLKETLSGDDFDFSENSEICDIEAQIITKEITTKNGRLNISSDVIFDIIYRTQNGTKCDKKTVNFEFSQDIENDTDYTYAEVFSEITDVSYIISSANSLDVRCNILFETYLFKENTMEVITEINLDRENKLSSSRAPITAYYPTENEELFRVAKKYRTTVDALKEANDLKDDYVKAGSYVIIA